MLPSSAPLPTDSVRPAPLRRRLSAHGRLKLFAVSGLMLWLGVPYYAIQHLATFPPVEMPALVLDRAVGFGPGWVWVYFSYYLLLPLVPLLARRRLELVRGMVSMALVSAVAFAVFLLFPTALPRPSAPDAGWGWRFLVALDRPVNVFPSLHAALSVHAALVLGRLVPWLRPPRAGGVVLWAWVAAILYSALATGQHVVLDLVGGVALGAVVWWGLWRRG